MTRNRLLLALTRVSCEDVKYSKGNNYYIMERITEGFT